MTDQIFESPVAHALLIGIDCYLSNQLPEGVSYPSLGGCVNDVTLMEEFLRRKLVAPDENILTLTSSVTSAGEPIEPSERWPTYENIVKAIQELTERAAPGAQVYIHYCGHGGRVPTWFPELKAADGLDETLVPMDIGKTSARHLRDIELAYLLRKMADKGLNVTLVLDCCHSGGATRRLRKVMAGEDTWPRGIDNIDTRLRPSASLVASEDELIENWRSLSASAARGLEMSDNWLWRPQGYVLLAACRPSEYAYECFFDGRRRGVLSYWLLDSLRQLGPGLTYTMLFNRIFGKVHSQFTAQTPMLVGEGDRVVFGSVKLPPINAVQVLQTDPNNQRVQVLAGRSQGVDEGAIFVVYPHDASDYTKLEERVALVEIDDPDSTSSWGKIAARLGPVPIEPGAQAILIDAGQTKLRRNVRLAAVTNSARELEALRRLEVSLAAGGNGWVGVAETADEVHYQVAINHRGEFDICDPAGNPLANLRPAIKAGTAEAAAGLVQRLAHLSKYHAVEQLDNADPMSSLARKLVVELYRLPDNFIPKQRSIKPLLSVRSDNGELFSPRQWVCLRIHNGSSLDLNVVALDLQPDWGITQIIPSTAGSLFEPLDGGEELDIPLMVDLPSGYQEGSDVIKVFATITPANFRWLELPALDNPNARAARHNTTPVNELEHLLAAVSADRQTLRHISVASYSRQDWVTAQVILRIKRESTDHCPSPKLVHL
jgi:hypothetical protein